MAAESSGYERGSSRVSLMRSSTRQLADGRVKKVCKFGVGCYQKNAKHLEEFCHPADTAYLTCCREEGIVPVFVTIRKLFEWCDSNQTGKATRDEIAKVWSIIQELGSGVPPLNDELWKELDDDGNGHVNFSEFAECTTKFKVKLPLGLDDLFETNSTSDEMLSCGVYECGCLGFHPRRSKCKWGETCFQKKSDHLHSFAHPGDSDWDEAPTGRGGDKEMCQCGHKRKLHASSRSGACAVEYPDYWESKADGATEFNNIIDVPGDMCARFQSLFDQTYSDVTTRDRATHSGSWEVPRGYKLVAAQRSENSRLWRKYVVKKAELLKEKRDSAASYDVHDDVLTSKVWESLDKQRLESEINEWYLFHGTSASAARNICSTDFKMRLAGTATGTLYGKGSYLAESITKADEYSKHEEGVYTVLLCRVLGGNVLYTAERTPDAEALTKACTEGDNDCIIGDRKACSGTYREFIIFDTENVYPEYILKFQRGEMFKSKSHPAAAPSH